MELVQRVHRIVEGRQPRGVAETHGGAAWSARYPCRVVCVKKGRGSVELNPFFLAMAPWDSRSIMCVNFFERLDSESSSNPPSQRSTIHAGSNATDDEL